MRHYHRHHRRRYRHHVGDRHRISVVLGIYIEGSNDGPYFYELNPNWRTHIMISATVGHKVVNTIGYVDTTGAPMLTPPTPDSPPTWVSADATATPPVSPLPDTLTISPDGTECDQACVAVGTDTLNLSVTVGGNTFTASQSITVSAAPRVLGGVVINSTVQ